MSHTRSDEIPDECGSQTSQTQFCNNLIANLFEQGISPCKAELPEIKIKRQVVEPYLKRICNLTQQY